MKSRLYTLTGDQGTTSLIGGTRVPKDDPRVEAYGTIDELNAHIGLLIHNTKLDTQNVHDFLHKVQNKLFNIGAYLANPNATEVAGLNEADIKAVEQLIDNLDAELPPMQGFILPGGSRLSALTDICRVITRRAERRVITLSHSATVHPNVLQYLNRLSDFFFVFARFNNILTHHQEIYWDKNA